MQGAAAKQADAAKIVIAVSEDIDPTNTTRAVVARLPFEPCRRTCISNRIAPEALAEIRAAGAGLDNAR